MVISRDIPFTDWKSNRQNIRRFYLHKVLSQRRDFVKMNSSTVSYTVKLLRQLCSIRTKTCAAKYTIQYKVCKYRLRRYSVTCRMARYCIFPSPHTVSQAFGQLLTKIAV